MTSERYISFRYADLVTVGDEVLIQENFQLNPSKVVNISSFLMQGKY